MTAEKPDGGADASNLEIFLVALNGAHVISKDHAS